MLLQQRDILCIEKVREREHEESARIWHDITLQVTIYIYTHIKKVGFKGFYGINVARHHYVLP